MKQIWPLLCAAVIALTSVGDAQAGMYRNRDGDQGQRFQNRVNRDPGRDPERDPGRPPDRAPPREPQRDNRRDDRAIQARAIASNYGRVIDVSPEGGPYFTARVGTPDGRRIELRINVDSGSAKEN